MDSGSTKNLDEETFQKLQDEFEKLDRKNFKAPKNESGASEVDSTPEAK